MRVSQFFLVLCLIVAQPLSAQSRPEPAQPSLDTLIDSGNLEEAARRIKAKGPGQNPAAELLLEASILHKQQRFLDSLKKTQESLERYAEQQTTSAAALKLFGLNLARLNKPDLAQEYFEQVVAFTPEDAKAWYYLGLAHIELNRLDEGLSEIRKSLEMEESLDGACVLGLALEKAGRREEAAQAYRRAAAIRRKLNSRSEAPHLYLGRLLSALEQHAEAAESLREAVSVNGANADAWRELGRSLVALNKPDQALEALSQALKLAPDDERVHFLLARVHKSLGNEAKSKEALNTFLRLEAKRKAAQASR